MNQTTPLSNVYAILNKVLNTLIRRKFGEQYSVRLNSLCFIANRTDVCRFKYFNEKIVLKTKKTDFEFSCNCFISIRCSIM